MALSALSAAAHGRHLTHRMGEGTRERAGHDLWDDFLTSRKQLRGRLPKSRRDTPTRSSSAAAQPRCDPRPAGIARRAARMARSNSGRSGHQAAGCEACRGCHASEPGHATTTGVPRLSSETSSSDQPYVSTRGSNLVWHTTAVWPESLAATSPEHVPVVGREVFILYTEFASWRPNASRDDRTCSGSSLRLVGGTAFDSDEMFTVVVGSSPRAAAATGRTQVMEHRTVHPLPRPIADGTVYVGTASRNVSLSRRPSAGLPSTRAVSVGDAGPHCCDSRRRHGRLRRPTSDRGLAVEVRADRRQQQARSQLRRLRRRPIL